MSTGEKTAVRQLIDKLNSAKTVEDAQKVFYDMLELERDIIIRTYDDAVIDMESNVTMDGYDYYNSKFDNQ
jgi:hypothetical protein